MKVNHIEYKCAGLERASSIKNYDRLRKSNVNNMSCMAMM